MMHPDLVPATLEHARAIGERARAWDVLEARELVGMDMVRAAEASLERSVSAWTWMQEGEPTAIFGLCTDNLIGERATVWLVTTPELEQHRAKFLRNCRPIIAALRSSFPVLESEVHVRYTACLRWIRWLGFTVHPARTFGATGALFHHVEIGA